MTVRQRDIFAAVKGAKAAGLEVARVEVDKDGRITIIAGKPGDGAEEANPLDVWMTKNASTS